MPKGPPLNRYVAVDGDVSGGDRIGQEEVVAFLADPASYSGVDRVERFETHGNLVFLAGFEAWKIKRAVRFPYMDFSTLEKRHAACAREVEINRRFGSALYLGCVPIARSPTGKLVFGSGGHRRMGRPHAPVRPVGAAQQYRAANRSIERPGARSGRMLSTRRTTSRTRSQIVRRRRHPRARDIDCRRALQIRDFVRRAATSPADHGPAAQTNVPPTLDERAAAGFVRRCHGDLHLANIVMWDGRPALYDAIEFDEAVATIDTLYDLAFLLMDLDRHNQRPAANIVLNRYLWRSRDAARSPGPGRDAPVSWPSAPPSAPW